MQNPKVQASYYKLKRNSKINHKVTQYKLQLGPGLSHCTSQGAAELWGAQTLHPRAPPPLSGWFRCPALVLGSSRSMPCPQARQCHHSVPLLHSRAVPTPPLQHPPGAPSTALPPLSPQGLPSVVPCTLLSPLAFPLLGFFPSTPKLQLLCFSHTSSTNCCPHMCFCSSIHRSGDTNPL